jgi:hypothetical protein
MSEDNPDDATEKNQPTSATRKRPTARIHHSRTTPPTQILPTIAKGTKHLAFGNIPEVQLHTCTTATGSSQTGGDASSTQTSGGAPRQSPLRAPLQAQIIQGEAEPDQIQVHDWDEEAEEEEAAVEEEKLARVQQQIEMLWQEQESIMRRQATVQRAEAHRQHINREWVRLTELQYTVDILHQ